MSHLFCKISGSLERISCHGNDIPKRKAIAVPTYHCGNKTCGFYRDKSCGSLRSLTFLCNFQPKVLKHMAKVVFKSENYKERNQCVFTLTSLKQRSLYGSYFFVTWQGLLQALNFPDDLRPTEVTQVEKLQLEVWIKILNVTQVWSGNY